MEDEKEYGFGRGSYEFGGEAKKEMRSKYDLGFKNKDINVMGSMFKNDEDNKTPKKESQMLNLGEDKMFTGNAYFDIGLAIGRRLKEKKANKSKG